MLLAASETQLLVIDIQARLLPVMRDGARVVRQAGILLQAARRLAIPALITEQYPQGLGPTVPEVMAEAGDAPVMAKMHFSAASDPAIRGRIEAAGRSQVVIAGIEAHVCVLQTALTLREAGHRVAVVVDAVSSRHADSVSVALQRLQAAGVDLVTTEMCLFEWLGSATHPDFKSLSSLIK
ncbi:MAG: isochorismatase family protein [Ferrovibrio sp.]|uniref:isochorismatase family protein n=1 Tax=Ferrovibrio sp. TaxID=1917215 RepID=UPI00391A29AF